jgi:hypothetical protein
MKQRVQIRNKAYIYIYIYIYGNDEKESGEEMISFDKNAFLYTYMHK